MKKITCFCEFLNVLATYICMFVAWFEFALEIMIENDKANENSLSLDVKIEPDDTGIIYKARIPGFVFFILVLYFSWLKKIGFRFFF